MSRFFEKGAEGLPGPVEEAQREKEDADPMPNATSSTDAPSTGGSTLAFFACCAPEEATLAPGEDVA